MNAAAAESRKKARFMEALDIPNPTLSELQESLIDAERKLEVLEDQQTRLNIKHYQNERLINVHRERVCQLRQDIKEKVKEASETVRHSDIRDHFTRATVVEIPKTNAGRGRSATNGSDSPDTDSSERPSSPASLPPLERNYGLPPFIPPTRPAQTPTSDHRPATAPLEID